MCSRLIRLIVCLSLLIANTDARAQIAELVEDAISRGVPLYNSGNYVACAEIYRLCLRSIQLLSTEEDLDYSKAVTQFNAEMVRLEATQASFARVAQLSLFEYI